jgi:hypothetical protein
MKRLAIELATVLGVGVAAVGGSDFSILRDSSEKMKITKAYCGRVVKVFNAS